MQNEPDMAEIAITIHDQEARLPDRTTVAEALAAILSGKQRKQAIAAYANGTAVDLDTPLREDTVIEPIKKDSPEGLEILRHSTAHIMAQAVRELFGDDVKIAIGPAIENGFYYDFLRDTPFSPEDFEAIEKKMAEIAAQAKSLTGQIRAIPLREIREETAIYYVGEFPIVDNETLTFSLDVLPAGANQRIKASLQQQFVID